MNGTVKQNVLTQEGYKRLQEELDYLKTVKRKEIVENIRTALSFGDLTENSEYDEAKNEQAKVEFKIVELEDTLRNVRIIDENEIDVNAVSMGSKVTLKNAATGEQIEYSIVGSTEADPFENKISDESPVGNAIVGKTIGEVIHIVTLKGEITYQIVGITK